MIDFLRIFLSVVAFLVLAVCAIHGFDRDGDNP